MALADTFKKEALPKLQKQLAKTSLMATPGFKKVVLNTGIGTMLKTTRDYAWVEQDLSLLSGQKAALKSARKSVSNFKLRAGQANGLMVTLRGRRMYDFLERLISVALPRVHDFKGLSAESFDGRGNYTFGIKEHLVFPEVKPNEQNRAFGMEVTIVTSANNDEEGRSLLAAIGFPLRK